MNKEYFEKHGLIADIHTDMAEGRLSAAEGNTLLRYLYHYPVAKLPEQDAQPGMVSAEKVKEACENLAAYARTVYSSLVAASAVAACSAISKEVDRQLGLERDDVC